MDVLIQGMPELRDERGASNSDTAKTEFKNLKKIQ